jgi:hypothetical protein
MQTSRFLWALALCACSSASAPLDSGSAVDAVVVRDAVSTADAVTPTDASPVLDAPPDAYVASVGVCDEAIDGTPAMLITLPGSGDRTAGSCTGDGDDEIVVRFTVPSGRELRFLRINAGDTLEMPTMKSEPIPAFYLRSACEGTELVCNPGCADCGDIVGYYPAGMIPAGQYYLFIDDTSPGTYSVRFMFE